MTIETVLQVVGVIVDINTICRLTNKKSIHIPYEDEDENGGLHDIVAELLCDNNWTIIDYDKNIGLYRMTHDIYDEEECDTKMILGIKILTSIIFEDIYTANIPEVVEIDIDALFKTKERLKQYMNEKNIFGPIKIYSVFNDCGCCS